MTTAMSRTEPRRIEFGPRDRIAVIAGSGRLPVDAAEGIVARGMKPFILMVQGEVTETAALSVHDNAPIALEEFGLLPRAIKKHGLTHVVLAGGISRRPRLIHFRPTFALLRQVPRVLKALAGGDNKLLSIVVSTLSGFGVTVLGVHEIVPELLAPAGPLTKARPTEGDRRDLAAAWTAAKAIGALDIGQAAIAIGGRAVELEGIEGTAALLDRVRAIRPHGRLAGKARGVLVKCAKPGQELRADLPAIGPDTIDAAAAAGLAGIGVEAGRAIVLATAETVAKADELGLFIVGLEDDTP
ncbi:MAG: UDP-2,3-diacylglucosamine diphosphatase LpxI [Rhizobiaceae bacterium]|nr:UDP-2,3-diacylglucosamine diphosphatase LpxI [Rhizobiaceae bacterium]